MKLIVIAAFSWAHRGVQVEHFAEGLEIDTEDHDLIDVSMGEGWTAEPGAGAAADADTAPAAEILPTQAPTPAPTQAPTEAPTEAPTPAPTEAPAAPTKPTRTKK